MFTFVKYNDGWWLKISSIEEYLQAKIFDGYSWQKAREQLFNPDYGTVKHFTSSIAQLIFERRKNNQTSLLEEYCKLIDEVTKEQLDCLEKYGAIYINKLGGYCFGIHDFDDICIKEELYFPSDDNKPKIKIKKWPGGSHYYAYINGREVKDEFGNIKWNTEKKANEVVLEYLNKNG